MNKIANIFRKIRKKTTDEEIFLPYRNGILHGRDLGYANVKVSAKVVSTLIALGDWASAIKEGKKGLDKEYVPPTLAESMKHIANSLEQMKENKKQRDHMDKWKKRELIVGENLPAKGKISDYDEDTPERTVIEFLRYLLKNNYGNMAKLISKHLVKDKNIGKLAGELRELFATKKLTDFEIVSVYDNAPAISEIKTILEFEKEDGTRFKHEHQFRLSYEDENGDMVPRGYKKAEWKIMIISLRNLEYIDLKSMSGR